MRDLSLQNSKQAWRRQAYFIKLLPPSLVSCSRINYFYLRKQLSFRQCQTEEKHSFKPPKPEKGWGFQILWKCAALPCTDPFSSQRLGFISHSWCSTERIVKDKWLIKMLSTHVSAVTVNILKKKIIYLVIFPFESATG